MSCFSCIASRLVFSIRLLCLIFAFVCLKFAMLCGALHELPLAFCLWCLPHLSYIRLCFAVGCCVVHAVPLALSFATNSVVYQLSLCCSCVLSSHAMVFVFHLPYIL